MRRGGKRSLFKADLPEVSEDKAKREVLWGGSGFALGLVLFLVLRPHSGHFIELMVGVAVVSSLTLGGMKIATWLERFNPSSEE